MHEVQLNYVAYIIMNHNEQEILQIVTN